MIQAAARYLLAHGLGGWCEGVVFLDESDEKVIFPQLSPHSSRPPFHS